MIDINMAVGTIMKMSRFGGTVRDVIAAALSHMPSAKAYFTELRFKPMPRYATGVVVDQATLAPGQASPTFRGTDRRARRAGLAAFVDAASGGSPVGLQFIQPRVNTAEATGVLLDDVLGDWWAVAAWGNSPARLLGPDDLALAERLGIRLVSFMPETQRGWAEDRFRDGPASVTVVGDVDGRLKDWFDARACGVVFLRPDRFVAAACLSQQASEALRAVLTAASCPSARVLPAAAVAEVAVA
jgi:3-(3-hydroxy-phenyl)propionate hydroxylase